MTCRHPRPICSLHAAARAARPSIIHTATAAAFDAHILHRLFFVFTCKSGRSVLSARPSRLALSVKIPLYTFQWACALNLFAAAFSRQSNTPQQPPCKRRLPDDRKSGVHGVDKQRLAAYLGRPSRLRSMLAARSAHRLTSFASRRWRATRARYGLALTYLLSAPIFIGMIQRQPEFYLVLAAIAARRFGQHDNIARVASTSSRHFTVNSKRTVRRQGYEGAASISSSLRREAIGDGKHIGG